MSVGLLKWEKWCDPLAPVEMKDEDEVVGPSFQKVPFMASSSGFMAFQETAFVSRYYNFWLAHANFKLTSADINAIVEVNGVEALNVYTRHRFRVAIGKAFSEDIVKGKISDLFKPKRLPTFDDHLCETLGSRWKFWAMVKKASGQIASFGSNSRDEVARQLEKVDSAVEVRTSWA